MIGCGVLARPGPLVSFVVALALATPSAAAEPTCPNEQAAAAPADNLSSCLDDAREAKKAGERRVAAATYARALAFARQAYEAGRAGAAASWYTDVGEQLVYYGTEGCGLAVELPTAQATAALDACIELLSLYLSDLGASGMADSRSAKAVEGRLATLRPQRDALAPVEVPEAPSAETPPVAVEPAPTATPAVESPPVDTAPVPDSKPAPARPPRGLQAGLGVSLGVAAVSAVLIAVGDARGRDAADTLGTMPSDTCDERPQPAACDDLSSARGLFVGGAVGLGLSLAASAILLGLLLRRRGPRKAAQTVRAAPGGLALRF